MKKKKLITEFCYFTRRLLQFAPVISLLKNQVTQGNKYYITTHLYLYFLFLFLFSVRVCVTDGRTDTEGTACL